MQKSRPLEIFYFMEGGHNRPTVKVGKYICLDAVGRTLLAWSGMAIIYAEWNPAKYPIT